MRQLAALVVLPSSDLNFVCRKFLLACCAEFSVVMFFVESFVSNYQSKPMTMKRYRKRDWAWWKLPTRSFLNIWH